MQSTLVVLVLLFPETAKTRQAVVPWDEKRYPLRSVAGAVNFGCSRPVVCISP